MYTDPKDCLYCTNNETLHNLMIEIAHLRVSRAFLFKDHNTQPLLQLSLHLHYLYPPYLWYVQTAPSLETLDLLGRWLSWKPPSTS